MGGLPILIQVPSGQTSSGVRRTSVSWTCAQRYAIRTHQVWHPNARPFNIYLFIFFLFSSILELLKLFTACPIAFSSHLINLSHLFTKFYS
jgi:hypothetical protein